MKYKIWDKTKKAFVEYIDYPLGETMWLALTPEGKLIQYAPYSDRICGEIDNPENFEIIWKTT